MKKLRLIGLTGVFLCLTLLKITAQTTGSIKGNAIDPFKLSIGVTKTTSVSFPFPIVSVDRGSKDVLAQKAIGVENVLKLKAAKADFDETNITVVTSDGRITTFVLNYVPNPNVLNLNMYAEGPKEGTIFFSPENINEAEVKAYAEMASNAKKKTGGIKDEKSEIVLSITGIFVQNDVLYFRVSFQNLSNINFDLGQLRFFIRDQNKARRTASQEIEITPVYVYNDVKKVTSWTANTIVFALPKFTVPDKKILILQVMEKNGGRNLEVQVRNTHIMGSTVLQKLH